MSDHAHPESTGQPDHRHDDPGRAHRDRGFTLPELLVTITIMGLIVSVLASAIIVTLRNADDIEGRINLAADEQSLGYSMPTDLASAATVDTDPSLTPCESACPPGVELGGSNAALLSWETKGASGDGLSVATTRVNVSYYFRPTAEPGVYQLDRIECTSVNGGAWTCESRVVLADLPGPPGGGQFIPGDTVPTWVIQVSEPLAPDATSDDQLADVSTRKDANRVVVTINGNGGFANSGGGTSQISITAGGTSRSSIPADSTLNAPSFIEARSKCGGPVTLIVDNSGSIKLNKHNNTDLSQVTAVENGVKAFIEAFAGTPTQLQVVRFSTESDVLEGSGEGDLWTKYFDLTDAAEVAELTSLIDPAITASGGTNWEDGWFRTFYEPDGTLQRVLPELTVFFTDGEPTYERLRYRSAPGQVIPGSPPAPEPGWITYNGGHYSNGSDFSQVAFNRTDWVADQVRTATRIIGIGVAGIGEDNVQWIDNPGATYDYEYFRGYRQHQRASHDYYGATWRYQKRDWWGDWHNIDKWEYDKYNEHDGEGDDYRRYIRYWNSVSKGTYEANNTTDDHSDGWKVEVDWDWVSTAIYDQFNTTTDDSDGYRDAGKQYVYHDNDATDWEPTTQQRTDGGYKKDKVYTPDGSYADNPTSAPKSTKLVLSRLVAGNDNAVEGIWDSSTNTYSNADVAEMYLLEDNWDRLAEALRSVAMSECGGTITVSTRVNGGGRSPDPFTFQNSRVAIPDPSDPAGIPVEVQPSIITTNVQFPTKTFDFDMPNGDQRLVDIFPYDLSSLTGYSPAATPWTCRAGITELSGSDMQIIPISGEAWAGVRVRVQPNQAVSCELNVVR